MARLAVLLTATVLVSGALVTAGPGTAATSTTRYPNCAALNQVYRHGVGRVGARDHVSGHTAPVTTFTRNNAVYAANTARDGDKDGIACERL